MLNRIGFLFTLLAALPACAQSKPASSTQHPQCDQDNGQITLPPGFCAAIFADAIGVARHVVVGSDGTVYLALESGSRTSAGTSRQRESGGIAVLRDSNGDGRADIVRRIPTGGGTGLALRGGWLYYSTMTTVERVRLSADRLGAAGPADTLVLGIPPEGHISRSLAFDAAGGMFVHVGSDSNVCTERGMRRGPDPCPELATRAGIWRYSADQLRQRHPTEGEHWAIGLRNAVGLAWDSVTRKLFAVAHGRDGLATLWPALYTPEQSAQQPSEEFVEVEKGDDFGWPYCLHDNALGSKVLAPEYGGDGRTAGRCAQAKQPLIGFPGHWGPDGLLFLNGERLPAKYRHGALIAFHGSWNRAPLPQAGYQVVFVPRNGASFGPSYETFADGFAGGRLDPGGAMHRPVGIAEGSDGAIYITDDQRGRVWRISYVGR
ncbi:MAG TPA: PQQ-dependent sugar dehydrogenase [Gemmatimonadales bacterium]|jgi:glucose/arabinose dehydrogenase|nr:PQQ-dependent sugar dehydrogenase [Gemmatimonadales bacterium]